MAPMGFGISHPCALSNALLWALDVQFLFIFHGLDHGVPPL